jgi:hypothetical protein
MTNLPVQKDLVILVPDNKIESAIRGILTRENSLSIRFIHKAMSASLYLHLAQKVSLEHCVDPSFLKLKNILHQWFPAIKLEG